jgi:hypothetical protein
MERFVNDVQTTLAEALTSGATTLKVASATGFRTPGTSGSGSVTSSCSSRGSAGTTFTVQRGAEGTAAAAHPSGAKVFAVLTVASLQAVVGEEATRAEAAEGGKLAKSSNLSDVANKATARSNLEAASAAEVATEKSRAEAAEGGKLAKSSNLSDLASAATARTNLGLGSAATHPSTDFESAGAVATETARAEAAEAEKVGEKAVGTTVMSQTDQRVEELMEALAGAFVPVYYGENANTPRPADAVHVLWIGLETVTPVHAIGFKSDPLHFDCRLPLAALPS